MKNTFVKIVMFFFAMSWFFGVAILIVLALRSHQERDEFPIQKGIVKEIHALKMGKGDYLVEVQGNLMNVNGSAFYQAYNIGEEVEVLMKTDKPRILNSKNAYMVISFIGTFVSFALSLFFVGLYGKNGGRQVVTALGMGFIMMSATGYWLLHYEKSEDKVWSANSGLVEGTLSGFHSKICKTKKSPKKEYPCYTQIIEYPLPDGNMHKFRGTQYSSKKSGSVGDARQLRYLIANPKEAEVFMEKKYRNYLFTGGYALMALLFFLGSVSIHGVWK